MLINAFRPVLAVTFVIHLILAPAASAQNPVSATKPKMLAIPEIPDTPRTVDPARFVPKKLAAEATVKFDEASLREVGQWIQKEQKTPVLFDKDALAGERIPLGEPVTDQLNKEPLYLLLNRLRAHGLTWYVRDDILHITTTAVAEERMATVPYNLGDLLDAGYKRDDLYATVQDGSGGAWFDVDGTGGKLQWLGDVLFVRQTDSMQRQIRGLLAALRKHARQTFTLDPPQHEALREKLNTKISVSFDQTPLATATRQLAEKSGIDIRLDVRSLRDSGVHERQPVTLTLSDRELGTVLRVLLAELKLTSILRDGLMFVTTVERADEFYKTAVYDVRDLCRDQQEANALKAAIQSQTKGPYFDVEGVGGTIVFARPGTMVVRHTERRLNEVGTLLTIYRKALRVSKPRQRADEKSREVVTRYYRMHEGTAADLIMLLPRLVQPQTWKSDAKPDAPGTILKITSRPGLLAGEGKTLHVVSKQGQARDTTALFVSQAVLVIRQQRSVHEEIADVIQRVSQGDPPPVKPSIGGLGGGLGGLGGGTFGSGFFSVP